MAVSFFNEDVQKPSLKYTGVKKWITSEIESFGFVVGNINYIFCSDEYLLEMNKKHLDHDYLTDIITFNYCEDKEISGDMYISVDRIKENSVLLGTGDSEIYRVIIHGVLHLCGYEDDTDEETETMRRKEDEALLRLDLI
jgi:probable rRNA maturation factor